jgi:hypothetical protein
MLHVLYYIVYNFVLMKNDTIVSVIICLTNEPMTFITITLICFKLLVCSVMRISSI